MKDIKEKIEGYQFNDFQYWEINNVHDMRLVSAIADNRILSKNFTKQIFIEYANEYDDVIRTMKEKSEEEPEGIPDGYLFIPCGSVDGGLLAQFSKRAVDTDRISTRKAL